MATLSVPRPAALDPGRITAGAGAIAANALGLMLLMVPLAVPPMLPRQDDAPTVVPIERRMPPPVPKPVDATITPPTAGPVTAQRPVERAPVPTIQEATSEPMEGDMPLPPGSFDPPVAATDSAPAGPEPPLQGARLEAAVAPRPPYPPQALRAELAGTVLLRVLVDVDGRPVDVTVERSSGHRVLDVAARRHVLANWTFRPAMREGRPVQAVGLLPVEFSLD